MNYNKSISNKKKRFIDKKFQNNYNSRSISDKK